MYRYNKIAKRVKVVNFKYESASAKLAIYDDGTAKLSGVFSRQRGLGHATGVLTAVTDFAEANDLYLWLDVQRYGYSDSKSLDNTQLIQFYEKHGFNKAQKIAKVQLMERILSQEKQGL